MSTDPALGFPLWLRINHYVSFLFMTLLIRSGIQILADHPRLYWNIHCKPNSQWLSFNKAKIPTNQLYTSADDEVNAPGIALPGGKHTLGIARHWHFFSVIFWVANWLVYVGLLFLTGNWPRLIPTSWNILPRALHTFVTYATFHLPAASEFRPYDPLQQLVYAAVIFVLAPLAILSGAGMSPAVVAHCPWYQRVFGNRQIARSIHFIVLLCYVAFILTHVTLVCLTGFSANMNGIVLGGKGPSDAAVWIGLFGIVVVALVNVVANWWSNKSPLSVQTTLGALTDQAMRLIFDKLKSRQEYRSDQISPYFWVNGRPPETPVYKTMAESGFKDYHLQVSGLVEHPLFLSMDDLRAMPKKTQTTLHNCIQGWSGIAEWGGVELSAILSRCKPKADAGYIVFQSFGTDEAGIEYYGTLDLEEARHPQTILAYEMNGQPLPLQYGAPLRLRVETKLGFKMVKYIRSIELVETYKTVGLGQGGYREDHQYFGTVAGI